MTLATRHILTLGAILLAAACAGHADRPSSTEAPSPDAARFELFVLGTAQDGGLPHLGCERTCCASARRSGQVIGPTSLGIHDRLSGRLVLVEATPAIESQIALFHQLSGVSGRGRQVVDAILVTHAHMGHYLGLAHLGREVAATTRLDLWAGEIFVEFLGANQPWKQLVESEQVIPHAVRPGEWFEPVPDLKVRATRVSHRDEFSETLAFEIRGLRKTVVFCPDIDAWDRAPGMLDRLLAEADVAYLDGTFFDGSELPDRKIEDIPHPPMVDTMRRLASRAAARPGTIRFIHLNHSNPALTDPAVRERVELSGFGVALVGERQEL